MAGSNGHRIRETKADLAAQRDAALQLYRNATLVSRAALASGLGQSFGGDRDLYEVLGYKKVPRYQDYLNIYERDGIATRVADSPADEAWRVHPILLESEKKAEDEKAEPSPLHKAFEELASRLDLWTAFNEADRACAISRFSLLYLGLPGNVEEPAGESKDLAFVTVHDEGSAEIDEMSLVKETDSERFGLPEFYFVVIDDQNNQKIHVHHSRVIHIKEGRERQGNGRIYGVPRLKNVLNRFYDLEKVLGGGSEAFWKLIYQGVVLAAKEGYALPGKDTDEYKAMQAEWDEWEHNLRRVVRAQGIDIQELGGQPVDSREQFDVIVEYISGSTRIPQRILLGSERGNLASTQDDAAFMDYIRWRQLNFAEPYILRPFVDKCAELGVLKVPKGYHVEWPSLFALTDLEKADLATKVAQAMASASGGAPETIMPAEEFAKRYLDFVWTPAMKAAQAEQEEKDRQAQAEQFGQQPGALFGGGQPGQPGRPGQAGGSVPGKKPGGAAPGNSRLDLGHVRAALRPNRASGVYDLQAFRLVTPDGLVLLHNEDENSAMIALRIPESLRAGLQSAYPVMDDKTRDELHVTLAYLGDARSIDRVRLARAMQEFSGSARPMKAKLQGLARFVSGGEQDPIVCTLDSPEFPALRERLLDALDGAGVPYHNDHGFIPHMTLAYIPAQAPMPLETVQPLEMDFYEAYVVIGADWLPFPLGASGPAPVQMRQQHGGPGPHDSGSPQTVHGGDDPGQAVGAEERVARAATNRNFRNSPEGKAAKAKFDKVPGGTRVYSYKYGLGTLRRGGVSEANKYGSRSVGTWWIEYDQGGKSPAGAVLLNFFDALDESLSWLKSNVELRQHHYGPGPHKGTGSEQSVHGRRYGPDGKSKGRASTTSTPADRKLPKERRVWAGKQAKGKSKLTKLEVGEIGEQLVERALEERFGVDFATLNVGITNSPIDVAGDHLAVEVKAGLATNGRSAQQWRATIGGMSPAERELYAKFDADQKRAWNARKNELILERKRKLLSQMSSEAGAPIKPMTVGVVLAPDGKRGDVYAVPGFHLRLGWGQYATDQYYLGTYDVN